MSPNLMNLQSLLWIGFGEVWARKFVQTLSKTYLGDTRDRFYIGLEQVLRSKLPQTLSETLSRKIRSNTVPVHDGPLLLQDRVHFCKFPLPQVTRRVPHGLMHIVQISAAGRFSLSMGLVARRTRSSMKSRACLPRIYPMLRNSASGPEIGLPGRVFAGF